MFALFFNLYIAMFTGEWTNYSFNQIGSIWSSPFKKIVQIITSWFNQSTAITDMVMSPNEILITTSFILTLITCIGIVVMAVKGIKKAFGIFFMGIR